MPDPQPPPPGSVVAAAQAHVQAGRLAEAAALCRSVPAASPQYAAAMFELGRAHALAGEDDAAQAAYLAVPATSPLFAWACNNLAAIAQLQGRFDEALARYRQALEAQPGLVDALCHLGGLHLSLGDVEAALGCLQQATALAPDHAPTRYNLGLCLLMAGNFDGFALYECRFAPDVRPVDRWRRDVQQALLPVPRWHGDALAGKRILLWCEQGLGDSLMMMRYIADLRALGALEIGVCCLAPLAGMMRQAGCTVLSHPGLIPTFAPDCQCPITSLPFAAGTRIDTIPGQGAYLPVDPALQGQWAQRLAPVRAFKVGVAWAGNPALERDAERSVALALLAPLAAVPGVCLVSLQKGAAAGQLDDCTFPILDWIASCDDLCDTAALVSQLDLVISVDTAVAHLAGGLGKPVWLLNRAGSEWRWMTGRSDSPWYPSMRIFRQAVRMEWDEVIGRVAGALAEQVPAGMAAASEAGRLGPAQDGGNAAPERDKKKGFLARWFG